MILLLIMFLNGWILCFYYFNIIFVYCNRLFLKSGGFKRGGGGFKGFNRTPLSVYKATIISKKLEITLKISLKIDANDS